MAAGTIGQHTEFNQEIDSVSAYMERVQFFLEANEIKPYWSRRFELTVHQGCIIWCRRVVVPPPGHESVLLELHGEHPGTS